MSNASKAGRRWSLEHRLLFGQTSCLLFGLGLILWALAPVVVARVISGQPPSVESLALNLVSFLMAVTFIGLHLLIKRRVRWAAWSAFLISCVVVGAGVAVSFATGFHFNSAFLLMLSTVTCFGSWLAIEAIAHWPIEGPYATAEDEPTPPKIHGTFVTDGPVLSTPNRPSAHDRLFASADSAHGAKSEQPDLRRLAETMEQSRPH